LDPLENPQLPPEKEVPGSPLSTMTLAIAGEIIIPKQIAMISNIRKQLNKPTVRFMFTVCIEAPFYIYLSDLIVRIKRNPIYIRSVGSVSCHTWAKHNQARLQRLKMSTFYLIIGPISIEDNS
jgi:hypothetical protein